MFVSAIYTRMMKIITIITHQKKTIILAYIRLLIINHLICVYKIIIQMLKTQL
jgi:hypothetical protein